MTIGINARFLLHPHTGIGQYTLNLLYGLAEIDSTHDYLLFTPELVELSLPDNFKQVRVQERQLRSPSLNKADWEHHLVPKEMEARRIQLAHFPYPANPWRRLPFPAVVTVHDVIPWIMPEYRPRLRSRLYHFYSRQALRKADHWITVSDFSKAELLRLFKTIPAKDVEVIPNGTPVLFTIPPPDLDLRRPYFLYVGGYDARKNVPLLIEIYQATIAPYFPVDLILVNGKNSHLERFINNDSCQKINEKVHLKNPGKVILSEPLEEGQLHFLYQKALAFIHLSSYEGFNIPLLEAMHFGAPALVSDIPVHREVARDAAFFVPPDQPSAIAEGMKKLIANDSLRASLIHKGKRRSAFFDPKKNARKTLEVYNLFG